MRPQRKQYDIKSYMQTYFPHVDIDAILNQFDVMKMYKNWWEFPQQRKTCGNAVLTYVLQAENKSSVQHEYKKEWNKRQAEKQKQSKKQAKDEIKQEGTQEIKDKVKEDIKDED